LNVNNINVPFESNQFYYTGILLKVQKDYPYYDFGVANK